MHNRCPNGPDISNGAIEMIPDVRATCQYSNMIRQQDEARPRTWKIGALVYTPGGLARLFGWLLWGDFAWQMRDRAVSPLAQLLLKRFGASDLFIGLLLGSIPAGLGLLIAPIVNTISDRYRSRMGRRIPFLLWPTPFAVAALIGLAFSPDLATALQRLLGMHSPGLHVCRLIVFTILWTVFEVSAVMTNGIFTSLMNDVVPHDLIGRFFGVFRMVSLAAGIIFNYWIIGNAEQHFRVIYISLAILYGGGLTLMCLRVKEGDYPPPPPVDKRRRYRQLAAVIAFFRETFSMPYYRWFYAAVTLASLSAGPVNAFSVLYARSIGMSMSAYGKYIALTYAISFCISFLLGLLADRFHPLRVVIVSVVLYTATALLGGDLALSPLAFGVALVVHGVLSGCLWTTLTPTYQMLLPKASFGEFSSAIGLVGGFAGVVLSPAVGAMLDATGRHYRYTFYAGGWIGLAAVITLLVVHQKFMALGGPKAYVAPE